MKLICSLVCGHVVPKDGANPQDVLSRIFVLSLVSRLLKSEVEGLLLTMQLVWLVCITPSSRCIPVWLGGGSALLVLLFVCLLMLFVPPDPSHRVN